MQKTNKFFDLEEEASTKPPVNLNSVVASNLISAASVVTTSPAMLDQQPNLNEEEQSNVIENKDSTIDDRIELIKIPSPTTQLRSQQSSATNSSTFKSAPVRPSPS